jgi:thiol-disulfide isomerase/thioredoxin
VALLALLVVLVGFDGPGFLAVSPALAQEAGGARRGRGPMNEPPFKQRVPAPSLDGGTGWLNTAGPLDLKDLRGKFVLLDFWTYCCINCMHVLPELKKLEEAYPNELVVIGVHSAKFDTEKGTKNIREAILRYEVSHPVVNDANHVIWRKYGVSSWPTLVLIDPEGQAVWARGGENTFEFLDALMKHGLPYYRKQGLLDTKPIDFALESEKAAKTPLRFPGKILADEATGRLFIADSNHNRIVVSDLDGKLIDIIGSGKIGSADGGYDQAEFDHPQGMALHGETLYIADTENHLIRKVNLKNKKVTTVAGTGEQGRKLLPGPPLRTAISSPWDVHVHDNFLYIAMAGPHQIWRMPLNERVIGPYAGNGREDIVDGPLLPMQPYQQGFSSFAQPSGLTSDGTWLYVADSEGSSVRAVPLKPDGAVRTVVGTSHLPYARLFTFGDVDGVGKDVRLQHVLAVEYYQGKLYIADTYNNKIKVIDPEQGSCQTLAGTGEAGADDAAPSFDEPSGLAVAAGKLYVADTNNHVIRVIDLKNGNKVSTLKIEGLTPPGVGETSAADKTGAVESNAALLADAVPVALPPQSVRAVNGQVKLHVQLQLPPGWKINPLAPQRYQVTATGGTGPVARSSLGKPRQVAPPTDGFDVTLPVSGPGAETLQLALDYYYCDHDGGVCKTGTVAWTVPLEIAADAPAETVRLAYRVP